MFLIGALALAGIPPLSGFWSKDGIISSALADGGALGYTLFVRRPRRRAPHRAYTLQALLPRLPRRAVRPRARARRAATARTDGARSRRARPRRGRRSRCSSRSACSPSSRRSAASLVIPGVWEPFLRLDRQVAEPLVAPDRRPGLRDELDRGDARAALGIWLARRAFQAGRELVAGRPRPHDPRAQALLRRALRRAASRGPPSCVANLLRDDVEEPVVQGSLGEIGGRRPRAQQAGRRGCRPASCARTRS